MDFATHSRDVLRGFDAQCSSFVTDLFFSAANIELIQKQIVLTVYRQMDCRIPYQSEEHLLAAMRKVLADFAHFVEDGGAECYRNQIRQLNQSVVDAVVPGILTAVDLQLAYEKQYVDSQGQHQFRDLLPPPVMTQTRKGDLPSVTTVWAGTGPF